jgi:tol-pal system protein YbgF
MRKLALLLALAAGPAWAQADPETLANIRAQIASLAGEVEGLRGELTATGALSQGVAGSTPLERLDAIEAELRRLTSKAEELEFRVNRIVTDGTNRLGDLEFRVCELEEGCDVGALGDTPALGGVDNAAVVPVPAEPVPTPEAGAELAVNEQADFERATEALASGDFQGAADLLAAFVEAYPGSPLSAQALVGRAEALDRLGETADAARAYLDAFSAAPSGEVAPDALLGLGRNLGRLGQVPDACVTLGEVPVRFPASPLVLEAEAERRTLGCP